MRLIDADELYKSLAREDDLPDDYINVMAVRLMILTAPTVEAIPKEFIEKKIDEYLELGLNSIAKELNVILAEWEKENEQISSKN